VGPALNPVIEDTVCADYADEDPTDRAQSVRWFRVMMENTSEEGAISNARGFYQRMLGLRENEFCDRQGREELCGHLTASEFWDKLFPDTIAT